MNQINVPLYGIDQFNYPFVEGSFISKTGERKNCFFLIDSGASCNTLNCEMLSEIDESWITNETSKITSVENKGEVCQLLNLDINVGGCDAKTGFYLSNCLDFTKMFGKNTILGILGVSFLREHQLALDFESKTLHSSELAEIDAAGKKFMCPMAYGIANYGIPVVFFTKDNQVYLCIADSGSNVNTLTQFAMEHCATEFKIRESEADVVCTSAGNYATVIADATLTFMNFAKNSGEIDFFDDSDVFQIISECVCLADAEKSGEMPILGVFGKPFMLKRKWILDFKVGIIYANLP